MATEKQRQKRRAARARRQARESLDEQDLQKEVLEPEEDAQEPLELEEVEKDMMPGGYYVGPTSWQEMDDLKAAREQAANVRQVTYETEDLVWNILNHPMKNPTEKAKAIQAVGSGFEERLAKVAEPIKKDMDILLIEAILAQDKRRAAPLEFVSEWISKAKLTASTENALSDEQFALVVELDGKKERKYPIHDKAHVRNALARAAQMMAEGGEAATDAKAALPKIRAAAKRMGIEMSMEKDRNAIIIEKDLAGDWRWIGWTSNNFIDWDGDIFSEDAHKEYVDWLEKNMDVSPVSIPWHSPFPRENPVDFATYENGFLIMSGKLTEAETEGLLKAKALADLGMSHGTFVLERDLKDPRVITKYRMYEVSDLPLDRAANPFTDFDVLTKEADMADKLDKKQYLEAILGKERAEAFLTKTALKQKDLQEAGIENKEQKSAETPAPAPVPPPPAEPEKAPASAPALDMEAIMKEVGEKFGMKELSAFLADLQEKAEKVEVLEALVKDMQGDEDEKLAEKLTPPMERFAWMQKARASQADETVVEGDEKEKLEKNAPGVPDGYWLSEATHTEPVRVQ